MQQRLFNRGLIPVLAGLVSASCTENTGVIGDGSDTTPPTVSIVLADSLIDINEGLRFTLQGSDNVSLLEIGYQVTGAVTRDTTITFTTTTPTFSQEFVIDQGFTGGTFQIVATALDGARNAAIPDTANASVFDVLAPSMTIISPNAGQQFTTGSSLPIIVSATDPSGISELTGSIFTRDAFSQPIDLTTLTQAFTAPLPTSIEDTITLTVPDSLLPGTYEVRVFGVDGATPLRSGFSASVNVSIIDGIGPSGAWINPPVDSAVVAGDPVTVRFQATDQTGVDSVVFSGFSRRGVDSLGTGVTVARYLNKNADAGKRRDTTLVRILDPVLTDSTPEQVTLAATVYDVGGTSSVITTTIQVVAGPFARVINPAAGSTHPVGVPLNIDVQGFSFNTIEFVGFTTSGAAVATDTVQFAAPLVQMPTGNLVLPLASTDPLGPLTISPFAIDALGNVIPGEPITIILTDDQAPVVTILDPVAGTQVGVGDSLRVAVQVQDNRGVADVFLDGVAQRGSVLLGTDVTVQRFNLKTVSLSQAVDTIILRDLQPVLSDSTAETGFIRVTARDSSGNETTATVAIDITVGPTLTILQPADSSVVAQGFDLTIEVQAAGKLGNKVKRVGFLAIGPTVTGGDSVEVDTLPGFTLATLPDTIVQSFDLSVPAGAPLGFFEIVPIGRDSTGNLGAGRSIFVEVVAPSGALDAEPPLVLDSVGLRAETDDSITVRASDLGGITKIGYFIRDLSNTIIGGDSVTFAGTRTNETAKFEFTNTAGNPLGLTVTTFPTQVSIAAFADDGVGNRGVLSFDGFTAITSPGRRDTLTLVAGITKPLPLGGEIADAILHSGMGVGGELYLTNILLDHVEVFDIETSSFVATIPTGSRPWGVALWPENTATGAFGDSIVVANSGGTNLSILDLQNRVEIRRHRLPNFIVQSVETRIDDASGLLEFEVVEHDFADRPQFVGMVCRAPGGGGACFADSIIAVYSTAPTDGQGELFNNRGSVRWENLTACEPPNDCTTVPTDSLQSHFFWEHAQASANDEADTLQIIIDRGAAFPGDTLVWAGSGDMVVMADLAFEDTTFVRNSGDFTHVMLGEGGVGDNARAIMYNATSGVNTAVFTFLFDPTPGAVCGPCVDATTTEDTGVLPGIRIRDFIANASTPVRSVGINFNGLTNMVRADTIYILDETLRPTGEVQVGGVNSGMDLNYDHDFDATARGTSPIGPPTGASDDRLLFAAVETPEIVAHDTFVFGEVARIPIKDPVIGFLRVAKLTQGANAGKQVLIGLTEKGVVTVILPTISNIFPGPSRQ